MFELVGVDENGVCMGCDRHGDCCSCERGN